MNKLEKLERAVTPDKLDTIFDEICSNCKYAYECNEQLCPIHQRYIELKLYFDRKK